MLLAGLKLRQRNLGPLLEATGWAVNGMAKINFPLGVALTERASIPLNARHLLHDPYADKGAEAQKRFWSIVAILIVAALIASRLLGTWPFNKPLAVPAVAAAPAAPVTAVKSP